MVGDLALLGMDLHGLVVAHRSGHQPNAALVRKLLQASRRKRKAAPACRRSHYSRTARWTSRGS